KRPEAGREVSKAAITTVLFNVLVFEASRFVGSQIFVLRLQNKPRYHIAELQFLHGLLPGKFTRNKGKSASLRRDLILRRSCCGAEKRSRCRFFVKAAWRMFMFRAKLLKTRRRDEMRVIGIDP